MIHVLVIREVSQDNKPVVARTMQQSEILCYSSWYSLGKTNIFHSVCGVTKTWNPIDDPDVEHPIISDVIGVAGEYTLGHGAALDPKITRLKTSEKDLEGIDIELHGGRYNDRKQKAVVSFLCEQDWTGNEGYEEDKRRSLLRKDDEDDDDDEDQPGDGERFKQDSKNALQFVSYAEEGEGKDRMDVLRLDWRTKYACEKYEEGDDEPTKKEGGWGFFTWFILM